MSRLTLPIALVVVELLIGCQRDHQAPPADHNPAAITPFLVKTNAGIDHEFFRDLSLDAFLKQLPTGSVDSINLDFVEGPQVFAVVKVPEQPGKDLTKLRFETSFKIQNGQEINKSWTAAKDTESNGAIAVFCLPPSVTNGETKVVDNHN